MASLETTASVLALVSLTVRFLRETADGIRKAHFFRGARFQRKIGNYDADLSTQRTRLLNSLLNVVRAADALHTGDCSIDESLNKGEIPALFQGPGLNARFHTILGQSSRRFLTHVARIESVLTEIKQGLGIRKLTEVRCSFFPPPNLSSTILFHKIGWRNLNIDLPTTYLRNALCSNTVEIRVCHSCSQHVSFAILHHVYCNCLPLCMLRRLYIRVSLSIHRISQLA